MEQARVSLEQRADALKRHRGARQLKHGPRGSVLCCPGHFGVAIWLALWNALRLQSQPPLAWNVLLEHSLPVTSRMLRALLRHPCPGTAHVRLRCSAAA